MFSIWIFHIPESRIRISKLIFTRFEKNEKKLDPHVGRKEMVGWWVLGRTFFSSVEMQ
jgi:hypothetical protein